MRTETVVRLWILNLFLLMAVILQWKLDPGYPVLLLPMGIVTAGIAVYGSWSIWQIFAKK